MAAHHRARVVGVHDVPGRRGGSAAAGVPGRVHQAHLPGHARSTTCTPGCRSRATGSTSGAADENKPAKDGTVEAFGRADDNPVGGWYGQRKGYRGRFGMYLPPLLEALGQAELTHEARNNKVRARAS